jgi:hypothetical protein
VTLPLAGARVRAADLPGVFQTGTDAWQSWTPVWTQSATISKTINVAQYIKIGRLVIASVSLTATSAGTAANRLSVTLPVTAASAVVRTIGSFRYNKAGTGYYSGSTMTLDATHVIFMQGGPACTEWLGATGSANAAAVAATDTIDFTVMYESAS